MDRKLFCQNCGEELAYETKSDLHIQPNEVEFFAQYLNADECLLTFKCPSCGCLVQIKH